MVTQPNDCSLFNYIAAHSGGLDKISSEVWQRQVALFVLIPNCALLISSCAVQRGLRLLHQLASNLKQVRLSMMNRRLGLVPEFS